MLSLTARLAAVLTILASGAFLAAPGSAAVTTFECGDGGPHECCIDGDDVCSGDFCCFFEEAGGSPRFCGCEYPE